MTHDQHLANRRAFYAKNRERIREQQRQDRKLNPGKYAEEKRKVSNRFSQAQSNARQRGVKWSISKYQFAYLIQQPCFYCDGPLAKTGCGLDRIDSLLGYSIGNVIPCCWPCNTVKGSLLSSSEMAWVVGCLKALRSKSHIWDGISPHNGRSKK